MLRLRDCDACAVRRVSLASHIVPDAATSTSSNKRFYGAYWTAAVLRVQRSHAASCETFARVTHDADRRGLM